MRAQFLGQAETWIPDLAAVTPLLRLSYSSLKWAQHKRACGDAGGL